MTAFVAGGAGFLLAVLWFDLMFDVQTLRHRGRTVPEDVVASIAAYYRRVTTTARPMNRLIGLVMLGTVAAIALQIASDDAPAWVGWAALGFTVPPITLAAVHTFPAAVRLGARGDSPQGQADLARSICRDHLYCFGSILCTLVVELGFGR